MSERDVTAQDVRRARSTATAAFWQPDRDNWRVGGGVDTAGDELTLICEPG